MNDVKRFWICALGSIVVLVTGGPLWAWMSCVGGAWVFNQCMIKGW